MITSGNQFIKTSRNEKQAIFPFPKQDIYLSSHGSLHCVFQHVYRDAIQ